MLVWRLFLPFVVANFRTGANSFAAVPNAYSKLWLCFFLFGAMLCCSYVDQDQMEHLEHDTVGEESA